MTISKELVRSAFSQPQVVEKAARDARTAVVRAMEEARTAIDSLNGQVQLKVATTAKGTPEAKEPAGR